MNSSFEQMTTPPDTSSDLFLGYSVIWACLFFALCNMMFRAWKTERRVKALEAERATFPGSK